MARSCLALVLVAGCGFSLQTGGDDQVPDGQPVSIVDDTKDDFVGTRTDATIAAWGAIEPDAFVVNGLHARAFNNTFAANASYTEAAAAATNPLGQGFHQIPERFDDNGTDHPRGLGIGVGAFTLLYDGEIYLPAGLVDVEVDADDRCAVELMLDGATWTDSMRDAHDSTNPITRIDVPVAGWYPIRAAFVQSYGSSWFHIYYTPVGGTRIHVDHNHTRARVTDASGLVVEAFAVRAMVRPLGNTAVANVDHDFGLFSPPWDLGIPDSDFTVRYLGQLRIDEPGAYTFSADASTSGSNGGDLWRIWIDGVAIAGPWSKAALMTATVNLEPGWHDFGVDFGEDSSDARIRARMSGPGIPEGTIASSRLRPAVSSGRTAVFVDVSNRTNIADATSQAPTTTSVALTVDASPGAKVMSIDWGFGIEYSRMSDLSATRVDCTSTGTTVPLGANTGYFYFPNDTTCAGVGFPIEWKYAVTDSVMGATQGNVWNPLVAATYRGGEKDPPFAKEAVFTSSVRETPNAIGYGRVKLDVKRPHDEGGARLEVRTAADAASIESALWVAVADGDIPDVEPGGVLQYRVTLDTGGWELVSVERVEIVYVVPE